MPSEGITPLSCVDCWFDRELVRQASYVYEGWSVCMRHMLKRRADTVEE